MIQENEKRFDFFKNFLFEELADDEFIKTIVENLNNYFKTKAAFISLVDQTHEHFFSSQMNNYRKILIEKSVANQVIFSEGDFKLESVKSSLLFRQQPYITSESNLNFYLAVPLFYDGKLRIGSVGFINESSLNLSNSQRDFLISQMIMLNHYLRRLKKSFVEKETLKDLTRREFKLRQLFEQSQDCVMTIEPPSWGFTSCNQATLDLFKVKSKEEYTKLGPWSVSPEFQPDGTPSSQKAKEVIMRAMEQGSNLFEWTHQDTKGRDIPCTVLLSRIEEGEKVYLQAVVRDISKQKDLEHKLLDLNQYLDLALQGAGLGVWDWDLRDNSVKFDRRWAEMQGIDFENMKMELSSWEERVHPDDLGNAYQDIQNYMEGKTEVFENVHRSKHEDGRWLHILGKGRFSDWDENGKPIRFTGTNLDITELEIAKQKLSLFYNNSPFGFAFCDMDGNLLDVNKQYEEITGYSFDELKKLSYWDITPKKYEEQEGIQLKSLEEKGKYGPYRKSYITKSGKEIPVELNGFIVKDLDGTEGIWSIIQDISEEVRQQDELSKQKQIAVHNSKLASIGELAAGVGHEINNPLAIVVGYLSSVEKKLANEKIDVDAIKKYLSKIKVASNRITKIVQGLRTFSRTDVGVDGDFSPLEALNESMHMVSEIYKNEGIEVSLNSKITNEIIISGNRGKFQQIIMNLLSNAKDAVEYKEDKKIKIEAFVEKSTVIIQVIDNGDGIEADIREKVFEPFFTTKEVNKGTGIGLSLVHNFVKELDGEVSFESIKSQGTKFKIFLPSKNSVASEMKEESKQAKSDCENNYSVNVLLVDDEVEIREMFKELLVSKGIYVESASNGKEALEIFEKNPNHYELIISDMKMPVMGGVEFLKALRNLKNIHQPQFIFITGGINVNFEEDQSGINHLFDGYLYKPFEEEKVDELLNQCLKNKLKKSA